MIEEQGRNTFSEKQNLKEFIINRSTLKGLIKALRIIS